MDLPRPHSVLGVLLILVGSILALPVLFVVFVVGYMFLVGDSNPNHRSITTPDLIPVVTAGFERALLSPSGTLVAVVVWQAEGGLERGRRLLILDTSTQRQVGSLSLPMRTGFHLVGWAGDAELWGSSYRATT